MNTDKIHGVPTPPLGYRLASKGDKRCKGTKLWFPAIMAWQDAAQTAHELSPEFIYAVPLKVSPLAPGRNINGLTEEQVGVSEGWRLITEGEFGENYIYDSERWDEVKGWVTWGAKTLACNLDYADYRTKAPLPQKEITPQSLQDDVESLPIPFEGQDSEEQLKAILARIAETLDYHSKVIAGIQNTEIKKWGRNPGDGQP